MSTCATVRAGAGTLYWPAMRFPWPLVLLAVACVDQHGPPPPASEFLVAAHDSTFWVTTGEHGVTVRGAPIALARFDGRLYELYVTDDDQSYFEAIMVGQRLYRRDLLTGDSSAVIEDTTVARLSAAYARSHPRARRLEPHEEASADPELYATADIEIIAVHGPYLSYEHHADIGLPDGSELHSIRRGVVDLRNGKAASAATLFGGREAVRALAEARRSFTDGIDSLLASSSEEAQHIGRIVRDLRFDPMSFSISRIGTDPALAFLVPGEGEWALDLAFPMSPIRVEAPAWWDDVRTALPESPKDAGAGDYPTWPAAGQSPAIIARYDSATDIVTLVLRDSAMREWKAAQVPPPVEWLLRLDTPPIDSITRRGLRRAFDEAALYSEDTRIATGERVRTDRLVALHAAAGRIPFISPSSFRLHAH